MENFIVKIVTLQRLIKRIGVDTFPHLNMPSVTMVTSMVTATCVVCVVKNINTEVAWVGIRKLAKKKKPQKTEKPQKTRKPEKPGKPENPEKPPEAPETSRIELPEKLQKGT